MTIHQADQNMKMKKYTIHYSEWLSKIGLQIFVPKRGKNVHQHSYSMHSAYEDGSILQWM